MTFGGSKSSEKRPTDKPFEFELTAEIEVNWERHSTKDALIEGSANCRKETQNRRLINCRSEP